MKSQENIELTPKTSILILLMMFLFTNAVRADTANKKELRSRVSFVAALEYVLDGDSLFVRKDTKLISIRLWGIDAPEYDQASASDAKDRLKALTSGKRLTIFPKYSDKYGRLVAVIEAGDITVNRKLVDEGYAWVHVYYCDTDPCSSWFELEKRAKDSKKGLWQNAEPVEPWVWKRKK